MHSSPKKLDQSFTYKDYLLWSEDERWELIDGIAYDMSPAPMREHQRILLSLAKIISDITDKGACETYIAPFDVRLPERAELEDIIDEDITTIVQPDISVFCNTELLDDKGAHGAPDLVVEILSPEVAGASRKLVSDQPSTGYKDQTTKLALYERYHVKEYWLVNGDIPSVMVYRLGDDTKFGKPDYYRIGEDVFSKVLGGENIPLLLFTGKK